MAKQKVKAKGEAKGKTNLNKARLVLAQSSMLHMAQNEDGW